MTVIPHPHESLSGRPDGDGSGSVDEHEKQQQHRHFLVSKLLQQAYFESLDDSKAQSLRSQIVDRFPGGVAGIELTFSMDGWIAKSISPVVIRWQWKGKNDLNHAESFAVYLEVELEFGVCQVVRAHKNFTTARPIKAAQSLSLDVHPSTVRVSVLVEDMQIITSTGADDKSSAAKLLPPPSLDQMIRLFFGLQILYHSNSLSVDISDVRCKRLSVSTSTEITTGSTVVHNPNWILNGLHRQGKFGTIQSLQTHKKIFAKNLQLTWTKSSCFVQVGEMEGSTTTAREGLWIDLGHGSPWKVMNTVKNIHIELDLDSKRIFVGSKEKKQATVMMLVDSIMQEQATASTDVAPHQQQCSSCMDLLHVLAATAWDIEMHIPLLKMKWRNPVVTDEEGGKSTTESSSFITFEDIELEGVKIRLPKTPSTAQEINQQQYQSPGNARYRKASFYCQHVTIPPLMEIHALELVGLVVDHEDKGGTPSTKVSSWILSAISCVQIRLQAMAIAGHVKAKDTFGNLLRVTQDRRRSFEQSNIVVHYPLSFCKIKSFPCHFFSESITNTLLLQNQVKDVMPDWEGDCETTCYTICERYLKIIYDSLEAQQNRSCNVQFAARDSLAAAAGRAIVGASIVTPLGVAASIAGVRIADGVGSIAQAGKEARGGDDQDKYAFGDFTHGIKTGVQGIVSQGKQSRGASVEKEYQFGDLTRGVISSFRSKSHCTGSASDGGDKNVDGKTSGNRDNQEPYLQKKKGRYAGIVGSSVGAAAGMVVLGPVGMLAGSFVGSAATRSAMERPTDPSSREKSGEDSTRARQAEEQGREEDLFASISTTNVPQYGTRGEDISGQPKLNSNESPSPGLIMGAVARGKKAAGRDTNSKYKFGDFTRGLFS